MEIKKLEDIEKELNFKFNYGLMVVDPRQEGDMLDVLHFCGYSGPPSQYDVNILRDELKNEPEFGLQDIADIVDILPAPGYIVDKYWEDFQNYKIRNFKNAEN